LKIRILAAFLAKDVYMTVDSDPYHNIRPYTDAEVPASIERLVNDKEFINAIVNHRFEHTPRWLSSFPAASRFSENTPTTAEGTRW